MALVGNLSTLSRYSLFHSFLLLFLLTIVRTVWVVDITGIRHVYNIVAARFLLFSTFPLEKATTFLICLVWNKALAKFETRNLQSMRKPIFVFFPVMFVAEFTAAAINSFGLGNGALIMQVVYFLINLMLAIYIGITSYGLYRYFSGSQASQRTNGLPSFPIHTLSWLTSRKSTIASHQDDQVCLLHWGDLLSPDDCHRHVPRPNLCDHPWRGSLLVYPLHSRKCQYAPADTPATRPTIDWLVDQVYSNLDCPFRFQDS